MKYVSREPAGAYDLTRYENYLERERGALGAYIHGAELLTIDRFVPAGPGSFHDARFESVLVATAASGNAGSGAKIVRAQLRLRGPYFDRHFELHYEDVKSFGFRSPDPEDDLLMHEIRSEEGHLIHEIQFDRGGTLVVTCRGLRFVETVEGEGAASAES